MLRQYRLLFPEGCAAGAESLLAWVVRQVAAACLYIVCRQDAKPFMLIDFSDALQINVFTLGAVFLQLCKVLRLDNNAMFTKCARLCASQCPSSDVCAQGGICHAHHSIHNCVVVLICRASSRFRAKGMHV